MTSHPYTSADLAARVGLKSAKTARKRARLLGIGINLDGSAGYRYSEQDLAKFIESMRPVVETPQRKRKRAA
jgi:hypothetical protein